eukprot:353244-Chlamydomonas_euryale.AAC.6
MIKKAVSQRKHLEGNRADRDAKIHLVLVESRIHRLARYYKVASQIPGPAVRVAAQLSTCSKAYLDMHMVTRGCCIAYTCMAVHTLSMHEAPHGCCIADLSVAVHT